MDKIKNNNKIKKDKELEKIKEEIFNILENEEKVSEKKLKEMIFFWLDIDYLYDILKEDIKNFDEIKILKNFQDYINKSI